MPAITSKHNSPLAAAVLALALWAGAPAQASRVATENDAIGSGLATVVHHPGSCSASSIGPYDRCAGFDFSGATLAGAQALGASQGWGPGIWNQSTDSIGTGTSTAALFDGNFGLRSAASCRT